MSHPTLGRTLLFLVAAFGFGCDDAPADPGDAAADARVDQTAAPDADATAATDAATATDPNDGSATDADAEADTDTAETALPCRVTLDGATVSTVEVGAGSRVVLGLPELGANPVVGGLAESWTYALVDGDLVIDVDYDLASAATLVVDAGCGQTDPVAISVRPAAWTMLAEWTGDAGPAGLEYAASWVDDGQLLVFGGFSFFPSQFTPTNALWRFDLAAQTWTELAVDASAPAGGGLGHAVRSDTGDHWFYGGLDRVGGNFDTPFRLGTLFPTANDAGLWTSATPSGAAPIGDYQSAFVWDAPRQRFVAVGGLNTAVGEHSDVRTYDPIGDVWAASVAATPDPVAGVPSGRGGFAWVHDATRERIVLFSGDQGGGAGGACNCATDTWALDLATLAWTRLDDGATAPTGRRNGFYTLDPRGDRLLLRGGTADGRTGEPGVFAFELATDTWHALPVSGELPADRASGVAAVDAAENALILGFGNSSAGVYTDVWQLSL